MPKAKSKSARPEQEEESEEEYEPTQSMTQADKHMRAMTSTDLERKVVEVVQYLLVADQKKLPIKRQDINKHVLKEHARAFPKIMEKVEEKLQQVFGFKLVKIEDKPARYIIVNMMEGEGHVVVSDEDKAKMGLLMIILSAIFMKNHIISDAELYQMLKKLGIDIDRPHEVFGDVKKVITHEFVRQMYLDYERVQKSEPPTFNFRWGKRAEVELQKRSCLDLVCDVYDTSPQAWTAQYTAIRDQYPEDKEGVKAMNGGNEENEEPRPGPSRNRSR